MISAIELTKETLSFLDALFIYKWTQSKDDLQKLINIVTPQVTKELEENRYTKNILEKYYLELEDSKTSRKITPKTKEILPQISGIMLLRQAIIEINKSQRNPITSMSSEDIKAEYGYLRVQLLEYVKRGIISKEYHDQPLDDNLLKTAQRKVDQYEDKFHEISNELGYQYLIYKNISLHKWLFYDDWDTSLSLDAYIDKDKMFDPKEIN